jgi:hypothetical protein
MRTALCLLGTVVLGWAYVLWLVPGQPGQGRGDALAWEGPKWNAVRAASYDPDTQVLTIRFASGQGYRYRDVPPECLAGFLRSAAKCAYFERYIRHTYPAERLDDLTG